MTPRWAGSLTTRVWVALAETLYSSPVRTCRYHNRAPRTRKITATMIAKETTRTCILPLVMGGVSPRFFAGRAFFSFGTGSRIKLYPLCLDDKAPGIVRQRAGLERKDVLAPQGPHHVHVLRVHDEVFEHPVDVVLAGRVGDEDL